MSDQFKTKSDSASLSDGEICPQPGHAAPHHGELHGEHSAHHIIRPHAGGASHLVENPYGCIHPKSAGADHGILHHHTIQPGREGLSAHAVETPYSHSQEPEIEGDVELEKIHKSATLSDSINETSLESDEEHADHDSLFEGQSLAELSKHIHRSRRVRIQNWIRSNPTRLILLSFAFVILTGALLLTLPMATRSGESSGFLPALFTATSATCVTGLIIFDTMTHWSTFGQIVIILLIQIGGLGLLTIVSAFTLSLHHHMNLTSSRALQESTAGASFEDSRRLVRAIMLFTLSFEAAGAVILVTRYSRYFPFLTALKKGCFQAVSAYCNAGFDLLGDYSGPFSSLSAFNHDPVILLTTAGLIISGGLGFIVWVDLFQFRRSRKLSFHSKLVLTATGLLLLTGTISFLLLEWNTHNVGTPALGDLPVIQRPLAAFFQSVTLRTAGFNSIDQTSLTDSSKLLGSLLMFIGAGPASTGGGIKVTTFSVLIAAVAMDLGGASKEGLLFKHKLRQDLITRALSISMLSLGIVLAVSMIMSLSLPRELVGKVRFIDLIYEATSAFGTVGVTSIGTGSLSSADHIALICAMYLGRVGPASFGLGLAHRRQTAQSAKLVLPEGKTTVG